MHIEWRIPPTLARPLLSVGVVITVGAAALWWMSAPVQEAPPPARIIHSRPLSGAGASPTVMVDVVGSVRHPGVVRLPEGSRVIDAVAAAGGLLPHRVPVVNMARRVQDGEQIVIGESASMARGAVAAATPSGHLDLNAASAAQLDGLPGIGPVLAKRIVDHRSTHGPFAHVRDLLDVPGIGDAKFTDLADGVSVS